MQSKTSKQYFILTDTRVPLLNFAKWHVGDYTDYDIDISQITMLTQARNIDLMHDYVKNSLFNLNVKSYQHCLANNFKDILHIPLHFMPLFSHNCNDFPPILFANRQHDVVFFTQSLAYIKGYRKAALQHFLFNANLLDTVNAKIYTKLNDASIDSLKSMISSSSAIPALMSPVKFTETKHVLRHSISQLCVSERDYIELDLLPNRIFETIAAGAIPLIDSDISKNTKSKELIEYINAFNCTVRAYTDIDNIVKQSKSMTDEDFKNFNETKNTIMQAGISSLIQSIETDMLKRDLR
jgi:hypothetical protein